MLSKVDSLAKANLPQRRRLGVRAHKLTSLTSPLPGQQFKDNGYSLSSI
jgi:hypothetical protein